jgi:hypothetical protein
MNSREGRNRQRHGADSSPTPKGHAVSIRPTMKKQNSHHERRRRSLVNIQRSRKETQAEFFSGHVAPASHVHEQVTSTKTADQRTKEAAGHTNGHQ